jgi:hypothetical protein
MVEFGSQQSASSGHLFANGSQRGASGDFPTRFPLLRTDNPDNPSGRYSPRSRAGRRMEEETPVQLSPDADDT